MIALSLCFGLYTLTIVESEYELEMTEVDIRYPADIMLLSYQGPELADNISAVEGIRECSPVTFIKQGTRRLSEMGEEMNLIFLDPDFILNHTTLEKGIFPEDDSNGLLESLKDPFNVIISRAHSRVDNLIVGDSINMYSWLDQLDIRSSYRYYENFTEDRRTNWDINLTVRGIFEDMPGLEIDEYTCAVIMSYGSLGRFLYNNTFIEKNEIDFKYSQETRYDFCSLLLIETRAGYDDTTIAEAIFAEYPFDTGNFRIKEERSSNLSGDRDSFVYLIGVEYGLILLISTIGLVFILWVSFSERRVETASMRARGASVGDIFRLFLSEALSYLAIGLIIGVVTGLISGIAYLRVIDDLTDPPYPREFIFSSTSLYMILLSCVFMIIIIVILATFMSGLSLGKTMRSRGD